MLYSHQGSLYYSTSYLIMMSAAAAAKSLQSSNSVQPQRRQPTRLPRAWDSPGKNTGVGCHSFLQCMKVKSESEVTQSLLTLSDPMGCSPPSSSVHRIFQVRVVEWGAIAFSSNPLYYLKFQDVLISMTALLKVHPIN